MHLYREEIWQDMAGYWFSNDTSEICSGAETWGSAVYVLGISLVEYVELLIKEFNAIVYWNNDKPFLHNKWATKQEAQKWKNFINKKAREKQIYFTV